MKGWELRVSQKELHPMDFLLFIEPSHSIKNPGKK